MLVKVGPADQKFVELSVIWDHMTLMWSYCTLIENWPFHYSDVKRASRRGKSLPIPLFNRLFRHTSKKISKPSVQNPALLFLSVGNPPLNGGLYNTMWGHHFNTNSPISKMCTSNDMIIFNDIIWVCHPEASRCDIIIEKRCWWTCKDNQVPPENVAFLNTIFKKHSSSQDVVGYVAFHKETLCRVYIDSSVEGPVYSGATHLK